MAGGLLDAAVGVAQMLVPDGTEIVSTSGRVYGEGTSLSYRSTKPPLLSPRTRLVVLVNSNTASAAEIVTGVVQVSKRDVRSTAPSLWEAECSWCVGSWPFPAD